MTQNLIIEVLGKEEGTAQKLWHAPCGHLNSVEASGFFTLSK